MTASEIIRLLNQVPPRYDLVVVQGDVTHRIHDLSFSHDPAQVTLRLVEAHSEKEKHPVAQLNEVTDALNEVIVATPKPEDYTAMYQESVTLRDLNAELLLELRQLRNGNIPPVSVTPNPSASFTHWWNQEGSGMAPRPDEEKSEHTRRVCEIAWGNGEYVAKYPTPEAACLPEPYATIAELGGEVPVDLITEVAPLPEPDAGEPTPTIGEQVVAAAKERRTRKPKTAPFGTA